MQDSALYHLHLSLSLSLAFVGCCEEKEAVAGVEAGTCIGGTNGR